MLVDVKHRMECDDFWEHLIVTADGQLQARYFWTKEQFNMLVATRLYISTVQAGGNVGETTLFVIAKACWKGVTEPRLKHKTLCEPYRVEVAGCDR